MNPSADGGSRGFVSVPDDLKIVSNIGGSAPEDEDAGALRKMGATSETFFQPHGLAIGKD